MDTKTLSWEEMCEKIKITSVKSYKSSRHSIKPDRVKVELDMPIEGYADFRRHIEAPKSLRNRRSEDRTENKSTILIFRKTVL